MYPDELEYFIRVRNYLLGGDDLLKATSVEENPQLNRITYNGFENKYYMSDKYGHNYSFTPMPYEKAKTLGLVKNKKDS